MQRRSAFSTLPARSGRPLHEQKPEGVSPGAVIERLVSYDGKTTYEGELGIVIGRPCTNVSAEEADGFIFGYTCVNDVTANDILNRDKTFAQWAGQGF
jgi:2-keto-4-pentenoate hydratase/2-oxohepta-3-ene-1,7-dioic acid hydratase in catechol pathway